MINLFVGENTVFCECCAIFSDVHQFVKVSLSDTDAVSVSVSGFD